LLGVISQVLDWVFRRGGPPEYGDLETGVRDYVGTMNSLALDPIASRTTGSYLGCQCQGFCNVNITVLGADLPNTPIVFLKTPVPPVMAPSQTHSPSSSSQNRS